MRSAESFSFTVNCLLSKCLKIKFLIMKAVLQSFILFLPLSEIVFGQEQIHGFFKFIGFYNEPQLPFIINKIYNNLGLNAHRFV